MSFIVSCSNFDAVVKDEIKDTVIKLGGEFKEDMTRKTNVVVSDKINTKKCIVCIL